VLDGVFALSAGDVWVVGTASTSTGEAGALIEHWGGAQWSVVPGDPPVGAASGFSSLTAVSATDI
jgi:hypothetical protein